MSKAEERAAHVSAWRASGLTGPAYCAEHGLKVSSLHSWSSRLRQKASKGMQMARVKKAKSGRDEVTAGTIRFVSLEVPANVGADGLRQILAVIEARR